MKIEIGTTSSAHFKVGIERIGVVAKSAMDGERGVLMIGDTHRKVSRGDKEEAIRVEKQSDGMRGKRKWR